MTTKLFIDGSSPKEKCYPSAYCIFKENKLIYTKVLEINLPAQDVEYLALIEALKLVKEEIIKDDEIKIFTDCGFMVEELDYNRTPRNIELFDRADKLLWDLKNVELYWLSREQNLAGKYLEKRLLKLREERIMLLNPQPNPQLKKERRRKIFKR